MEIRLATKEEHLLEKDLIFEQVCRITERHHTRAKAGKEDTVTLAKKVGNLCDSDEIVCKGLYKLFEILPEITALPIRKITCLFKRA